MEPSDIGCYGFKIGSLASDFLKLRLFRLAACLGLLFCFALRGLAADSASAGVSASQIPPASVITNALPATNPQILANAFSTMETLDDKYKLALGDQLSFRILEDQQDPRETFDPKPPLVVTDSGDLEVPYIGRYPAAGKTCRQLAAEIKAALETKYYYQATVILALNAVAKSNGRVYVNGEVRATGAIEIPGDEVLTLSKAILRAGGFTEYANKRHVKLTHQAVGNDASRSTVVVNVNEILEDGRTDRDPKLAPGDTIFVPTRLITF